eukprot:scaffold1993_cov107-Cylindrotheca_fusiformis.AAC.2
MRFQKSRDKRRPLSGKHKSSSRKYGNDGYSEYESRGPTPYSEYDRSVITDGRQTAFSEYTDGNQTPYTEYTRNESGKHTPYSEYATEYTYGTYDDRNPGTLGIERNQYCTQLNGVFGAEESTFDEDSGYSSYSQSYSESDYDQICDTNVNTNCMNTLFNRNTDSNVPGTIHCGGKLGRSEDARVKMTLPLPLQYMDHFVPSKNDLNTVLDTFTKKCDNGHEGQVLPQVYKSLFEAASDGSSFSEEDEVDRRDLKESLRFKSRKSPRANRGPQHAALAAPKVGLDSPPSQIVIKDDATAVSSADSLGFTGDYRSPDFARQHRGPSKRIVETEDFNNTNSQRLSPRHVYAVRDPFREHSTQMHSPKSPHGLDRIMSKQVGSPKNRCFNEAVSSPTRRKLGEDVDGKERIISPRNRYTTEMVDFDRSTTNGIVSPRDAYSKNFFGKKEKATAVQDKCELQKFADHSLEYDGGNRSPHAQWGQSTSLKRSSKATTSQDLQWQKGEKEHLRLVEESSSFENRPPQPIIHTKTKTQTEAQAKTGNSMEGSIPYAVSFGMTPTTFSDLTSEFGDFGTTRVKPQVPPNSMWEAKKHNCPRAETNTTTEKKLISSRPATPIQNWTDGGDDLRADISRDGSHRDDGALKPAESKTETSTQPDKNHSKSTGMKRSSLAPKKAETLDTIEDALMGPGPRKVRSPTNKSTSRETNISGFTGDELMGSEPTKSPSNTQEKFLDGDELMRSPKVEDQEDVEITGVERVASTEQRLQCLTNPSEQYGDELMGRLSPNLEEATEEEMDNDGLQSAKECKDAESLVSFDGPYRTDGAGNMPNTPVPEEEPVELPPSMYPEEASDYCDDRTGAENDEASEDKQKGPLNSISDLESQISNLESQISKLELCSDVSGLYLKKRRGRLSKTCLSQKQIDGTQKQIDATLVTAPTALTTETPFTFDTPMLSSPTSNMMEPIGIESKTKRFVAASVTLPIHRFEKDTTESLAIPSFYIVLVQGTKKCLTDLLIIIIAWARHFSYGHGSRSREGGMKVGMFLPTLDDKDAMQEYAVQGRPLAFYRLPSLSSDEPGIFFETFVPENPRTVDQNGRLSIHDICVTSRKPSFWPTALRNNDEIPTAVWETEQSWSDKYDRYEEFGIWNQ